MYSCIKLKKIRLVEAILRRRGDTWEIDGGNESKVYFKYICKCTLKTTIC
jgi:hypothetical protein